MTTKEQIEESKRRMCTKLSIRHGKYGLIFDGFDVLCSNMPCLVQKQTKIGQKVLSRPL